MKLLLVSLAMVGAGVAVPSLAQGPQVQVRLGPAVQAWSRELGADALEQQRQQLQRAVEDALRGDASAPAQVSLVIEDIEPNRPTSAQLGRSPSLSPASISLGGAAITGQVSGPGGAPLPVRYRFFAPDLQSETNFDTWGDADQAFQTLAHQIAAGRPPDDRRAWPPPHTASAPTGTRIPG